MTQDFSAPEVELRIALEARLRPDVIASRVVPQERYPTRGPDIVVEIISEDDKVTVIRDHCQKYEEWGCQQIYLVDPSDRSVMRWEQGSLIVSPLLAAVPVEFMWAELDRQFKLSPMQP